MNGKYYFRHFCLEFSVLRGDPLLDKGKVHRNISWSTVSLKHQDAFESTSFSPCLLGAEVLYLY